MIYFTCFGTEFYRQEMGNDRPVGHRSTINKTHDLLITCGLAKSFLNSRVRVSSRILMKLPLLWRILSIKSKHSISLNTFSGTNSFEIYRHTYTHTNAVRYRKISLLTRCLTHVARSYIPYTYLRQYFSEKLQFPVTIIQVLTHSIYIFKQNKFNNPNTWHQARIN